MNDFLDLIPGFKEGANFYLSAFFAIPEDTPTGCDLAKYIKNTVKNSKVFLVTTVNKHLFSEDLRNGIIDGVYSKSLIYDMPHSLSGLTIQEKSELIRLLGHYDNNIGAKTQTSQPEADYDRSEKEYTRIIQEKMKGALPTAIDDSFRSEQSQATLPSTRKEILKSSTGKNRWSSGSILAQIKRVCQRLQQSTQDQ